MRENRSILQWIFGRRDSHLDAHLHALHYKVDRIMATLAEATAEIRRITAQNEKARTEIRAAFKKLQDQVDNLGQTTPEFDAAMVELGASVQTDDDEHADSPAPV